MSADWPILQLGDLVTIKGGKRLPKGSSLQTDVNSHPYIRVRDMGERYLPNSGLEYVPSNIFPFIKRYVVENNDVIISIVGTIGRLSVIDERFHLASQTENCAKLSGLDRADALYIYYFLSSCSGQQEIKKATVGAVQAKLPLYNIKKLSVIWPNRKVREMIVFNLGGIDDKIELNRQTNQTLEQIAQAIFKSWFIDFEPVKAKIAAKQKLPSTSGRGAGGEGNEHPDVTRAAMCAISGKTEEELEQLSPETLQQLKTTAALFPDTLVESELGEIPEGWENGILSDICSFDSERINVSKLMVENYISTENMIAEKRGITVASSLPTAKTVPYFKEGQVLISNIRPYFKKIWLTRFEGGRSNDVLGIKAIDPVDTEFLYNLLYQDVFFNFMMTTSKGAKMPRGDKDAIMGWSIINPPIIIRKYYSKVVIKYYEIIEGYNKENQNLEKLRNTLLPKLLSGELALDKENTC